MPTDDTKGLSRRGLLGLAGAGVVGAGLGVGGAFAIGGGGASSTSNDVASTYPFFGDHQSGIITPAQDRLHFAAFDVNDISRDELIELLRDWSYAAARMTAGQAAGEYGPAGGPYDAPPDDTGEALDLPPGGLTITFGFGPSLFDDRFGLAGKRPSALIDLPKFPSDALLPELVGGDLCIQACSDDPQVAVHAIRNLSRIAFGRATLRWSQLGFGRTSSTTQAQKTPRNLFGFKDGTANLRAEDTAGVNEHVWAASGDGTAWMAGGSYLVSRKIRMTIETWDRTSLREQETIFGRTKGEGAPLSGGSEFTDPDFKQTGRDDAPLIDDASHVKLAHPDTHGGAQILRRGYNFVDGNDELGRLNAGLFFISFQRDPEKQFVPIQLALSRNDLMNEYVRYVGSAIFAVPPGASTSSFIGAGMFDLA
ncbi:iron uptake transporter deferrochelatase/peroxidase subunit [Salinibacterium sp. SWN1162]|uniref:iron uptake transporter deferrochelatase/peroxidase subunit n=1 Tax=Salinibacterium sp. SWN1162 TaxID=2792053 RepID=UPI0018CF8466|nr:iron uptake transporter deferrochelatase/peroxidase subunit [Salinibacterium sp. SWN1162]MBH0010085.1 deferrochelatase/peroxidase EfeB [Salinibacterium sp. SWN1162]